MYRLKSTEGEETLKTVVKLTHRKKNSSQKPPNCSNTNFSLHFNCILEKKITKDRSDQERTSDEDDDELMIELMTYLLERGCGRL